MTENRQDKPGLSPEPLMQMSFSFAPARILSSSVQLNLFSHIAAGKHRVSEIAQAAGAVERGTRMLLDALVSFQLLTKSGDRYELTPISSEFLVRESPNHAGTLMEHDALW